MRVITQRRHTGMQSNDWTPRTITKEEPYRINFVCLGNICRSPTAEGIFQHLVNEEELQSYFFIDSSGTSGWHRGEPANQKSQQIANKYGVRLLSRSRPFEASDLDAFDLILAMDTENHRDILKLAQEEAHRTRVRLMREFDLQGSERSVPDPYHGGMDGFDIVYKVLHRSCIELLHQLKPAIRTDS